MELLVVVLSCYKFCHRLSCNVFYSKRRQSGWDHVYKVNKLYDNDCTGILKLLLFMFYIEDLCILYQ